MIPEFYEYWRKQADIQLEKDRQAAAAAEKKELLRDILLILAAPLAVAAVLAAPTICQAAFG